MTTNNLLSNSSNSSFTNSTGTRRRRRLLLAASIAVGAITTAAPSAASAEVGAGQTECFDTGAIGPVGVVLNGTAAKAQGKGFLNFFGETDDPEFDPSGNSSVNYDIGANIANGVVTPSSDDGRVCVYSSAETEVIVDVAGFIAGEQLQPTVGGTARVFDTRRSGDRKFEAGETFCFRPFLNVGEGRAVLVNGLAAAPESRGFLNFYPKGSTAAPDATSVLNFEGGVNVANGVIATTGTDGEMCIYSSARTHVVIDLIAALADGSYRPANADNSASRLLNTRTGAIPAAGTSVCFATGAAEGEAVVINGTAVNAQADGYLNLYPQGAADPTKNSSVNYQPGANIANGVIIPAGTGGEVCAYVQQSTHVLVDLAGFLTAGVFTPVSADGSADRVLDTRS